MPKELNCFRYSPDISVFSDGLETFSLTIAPWILQFPKSQTEYLEVCVMTFKTFLEGGQEISHSVYTISNKRNNIWEHILFCEHSNMFLLVSINITTTKQR